jgi:hypothetical protein
MSGLANPRFEEVDTAIGSNSQWGVGTHYADALC